MGSFPDLKKRPLRRSWPEGGRGPQRLHLLGEVQEGQGVPLVVHELHHVPPFGVDQDHGPHVPRLEAPPPGRFSLLPVKGLHQGPGRGGKA